MPLQAKVEYEGEQTATSIFLLSPGEHYGLVDPTSQPPKLLFVHCDSYDLGGTIYLLDNPIIEDQDAPRGNCYIDPRALTPQRIVSTLLPGQSYEHHFSPKEDTGYRAGRVVIEHVFNQN